MSGLLARLEELSPRKRELLLRQLRTFDQAADPEISARRPGDVPLPLSFSQLRQWFLDELEPGNPAFHLFAGLRVAGPLSPVLLAAAMADLLRRHEALRTRFVASAGEPEQVVDAGLQVDLPLIDVGSVEQQAQGLEIDRLAGQLAGRPFDLSRGPLLRACLVRLGQADHALLIALHHIVADGWSMGLFFRDLLALYGARQEGRPAPLPVLAVQYPDFALWQRSRLQGEILEDELAYWRARLSGCPEGLDLPADRPRPEIQSYRGGTYRFSLVESLSTALRSLGRRTGATSFMVLLAAFAALLRRYTGWEDLAIGSPIAGRNRVELEGLIGFFVNTLVLRIDAGGNPSFLDLLQRVSRTTLEAYQHQDLPFERLVEELKPERSLGRQPLIQVLFQLQNTPVPEISVPGLALLPLPAPDLRTASFDLTLSLTESEGCLHGLLQYSSDLFHRSRMARLAAHLETLLTGAAADPERRLAALPLLSEAESFQVLREWGGAAWEDGGAGLAEFVGRQVARTPDATAVRWDAGSLTYAELDRRAGRLAAWLMRKGAGPEVPVAVACGRSPELLISVLAILRAGAPCLPLDTSYPAARRSWMLEDSGAGILLEDGNGKESLFGRPGLKRLSLAEAWKTSVAAAAATEPTAPDASVYLIYTSGSTGRPKGVAMTHRVLADLVRWQLRAWRERGSGVAVTLQFAPFSFDVFFQEVFATWAAGGELVLIAEEARRDPERLLELLARQRVERLFLPFVALRQLAEAAPGQLPGSLREVITAGEQLKATPAIRDLFRSLPGARLFNQYGPSETHVVTAFPLAAEVEGWDTLPPIGRPVAGARIHLLDRDLEPAPVGVPGDLYVAGAPLARGYWRRSDLTAERFLPDPFAPAPGGRLYRTGDRGRFRADGGIEFLGRADDQVKVRGHRVEPGEVEAALGGHPGVRECCVVARNDAGDVRLVAYFVAAGDDGAVVASELRRFLRAALPEPMVPAAFVLLPALPLTPSGKVDRRALPAPGPAGPAEAPGDRSPVEEIVGEVWSEVLGREAISLHESFFDLGGHSLLATQVMSRLRQAFQVELPVRSLFERPTVASLALLVEETLRREPVAEAPPIGRMARIGRLPLSFSQQRLWFLDQLQPGLSIYNVPAALHLRGALDRGALSRCFAEIERRHEVLRTTFPSFAGEPAQEIGGAGVSALATIDLAGLASAEEEAQRLLAAESWRPFDLACGPLARWLLLCLSAEEHLLLMVLHHIVSDAWSIAVMLREVELLYAAAVGAGPPSPLPELPIQYADFAGWQRSWLAGETLERQLAHWRPRLQGAPRLELPTDRLRPAVQTYSGSVQPLNIPQELWEDLRSLSRRERLTPFMVVLAALQVLLLQWGTQEDVSVGFPVAGRSRPEIEGLVGCFVNTLVLRCRLRGGMAVRRLLADVRREALEAFAHQDLPFERLVEELQPDRQLSHSPLFQVLLVLVNVPRRPFELPGVSADPLAIAGGSAKFDLTLSLAETGRGLAGAIEYNADLFLAPTVARLAGHLETLLRELAGHLDRPLRDVPLLGPGERHQLLAEWAEVSAVLAESPVCLQQMIEVQAARTPAAVAIVDREGRVTYRELEEQANQLAHHLIDLGVGPEVRVGLCLDREARLVVAMLAVLKAGGAYVPLDPAYPRERLRFMVEDSGAALILCGERGRERLGELAARRVDPQADRARIEARRREPPRIEVTPGTLSHLIYTSGSTGAPKGTAIVHRGVVALLRWAQRAFTREELAGVLAGTSVSFDLSVFEIFTPLSVGGQVILAENVLHLPELPAAGEVTLLNTVPSALAELLRVGALPASVRTVCLAGEALRGELAEAILGQPGVERLFNLYGPSEGTTYSTWTRIEPGEADPLPIGGPIDGTRAYVLNADLQPLPIGVPGELYLGGEGLARGYLGRPALTAERFVPDGWSGLADERLYRTGDRVVLRSDGRLAFLGRMDHQIKVRGYRVEPGEIEAALARHPGVAETAVVLRPTLAHEEPRLVAYVVPVEEPGPAVGELRRHLRTWLPGPLVPEVFAVLERLPRTGSGKVDRRALPDPGAAPPPTGVYEEPRTAVEQAVAQAWREVLRLERIGLDDNFFELGGHSLLLARVHHRLKPLSQRPFPLVALFEHTTVRALASFLEGAERGAISQQVGRERGARRRMATGRRQQIKDVAL